MLQSEAVMCCSVLSVCCSQGRPKPACQSISNLALRSYATRCLAYVLQMEAALACLQGERERAALDQLEAVNTQLRDQLKENSAE